MNLNRVFFLDVAYKLDWILFKTENIQEKKRKKLLELANIYGMPFLNSMICYKHCSSFTTEMEMINWYSMKQYKCKVNDYQLTWLLNRRYHRLNSATKWEAYEDILI